MIRLTLLSLAFYIGHLTTPQGTRIVTDDPTIANDFLRECLANKRITTQETRGVLYYMECHE